MYQNAAEKTLVEEGRMDVLVQLQKELKMMSRKERTKKIKEAGWFPI